MDSEKNSKFLLAVVHEFLSRKDRNLATVFKSKCNSVSYYHVSHPVHVLPKKKK